jgi:hypothetical protein
MNLEEVKIKIGNDVYKFDYATCGWMNITSDPKQVEQVKESIKQTESALEQTTGSLVESNFILKEIEEKTDKVRKEHQRLGGYDDHLNEIVDFDQPASEEPLRGQPPPGSRREGRRPQEVILRSNGLINFAKD